MSRKKKATKVKPRNPVVRTLVENPKRNAGPHRKDKRREQQPIEEEIEQ